MGEDASADAVLHLDPATPRRRPRLPASRADAHLAQWPRGVRFSTSNGTGLEQRAPSPSPLERYRRGRCDRRMSRSTASARWLAAESARAWARNGSALVVHLLRGQCPKNRLYL